MKRLIAIGVLSALFGASCSGDGRAEPTSSPSASAVTTDVVSTTVAATVPPTSSTAAGTTTTLPVTTTTIATEDLIKQAVQDYIAAYFTCGQVPAECDPATFTASQGPSRAAVTELIAGMVKEGLYFSTDVRGSYIVAESVIKTSDVQATSTFCASDGLIVLGPNGPDGAPTVVNDVISSSRYMYQLFLEGGTWRVGEQEQLERLGEGTLCPAA
jgi:hypothetical protein